MSELRELILTALQGEDKGLTAEQIADLIGNGESSQSVGQALRHMQNAALVVHDSHQPKRWRLFSANSHAANAPVNTIAERTFVAFSELEKRRAGLHVSLYVVGAEYDDVRQLWLKPEGQPWFEVPIWGNLRMYSGEGRPNWDPRQRTYRHIERYGIVTGDGRKQEYAHISRFQLTIAPEG